MTETESERVRRILYNRRIFFPCPRANLLKNPINIGDIDGGMKGEDNEITSWKLPSPREQGKLEEAIFRIGGGNQ